MRIKKFIPALLAGALMVAPLAAKAASTGVWAGADFGPNSAAFVYAGGITSLSHKDLFSQDGFLARIDLVWGQFDYNTTGVPGGSVDGTVFTGDIMAGYRHGFGTGHISGYIGGDLQDHHLSPNDLGNSVRGSEGGVKVLGEADATVSNIALGGSASWSSAFQSYRVHEEIGYKFPSFTVGPTATQQGNKEWNQYRFGGAVSNIDLGFAHMKIDAGYSNNSSNHGHDGAYGGIGFARTF